MSYNKSLDTIDRYFFGRPLAQWAKENAKIQTKTTKFVESSIDDFNKHFDFMVQAFKRPLERTPDTDVFVPDKKVLSFANVEDSFGPSY